LVNILTFFEGVCLWRRRGKCDMVRRVKRQFFALALCSLPGCSGRDATTLLGDAAVSADAAADVSPKPVPDASVDAEACTLSAPYSTKNERCNTCAEAHCCADINACYASKDCDQGYVNCLIACAVTEKDKPAYDACAGVCAKDYPAGKVLYDAFSVCVDTACPTPCGS
jgi:hypothetical protein